MTSCTRYFLITISNIWWWYVGKTIILTIIVLLNPDLYRGSYMRAHVLLTLLNQLGKSDKMQGLPSILLLFRNEFNKLNNTGARMLDSIYHMTLKLFCNRVFGMKTSRFCKIYVTLLWASFHNVIKIYTSFMVYRFYNIALYHSQTRRHMIIKKNIL